MATGDPGDLSSSSNMDLHSRRKGNPANNLSFDESTKPTTSRPIVNPYKSPSPSISTKQQQPTLRPGRGSTLRQNQFSILHPLRKRNPQPSPGNSATQSTTDQLPMDCELPTPPTVNRVQASTPMATDDTSTPGSIHSSSTSTQTTEDHPLDGFLEVGSKKSAKKSAKIRCPLDDKKYRFGILFNRVATKQILQNQGVDVGAILNAILDLDPEATYLPHDNDTTRAAKLSTLLKTPQDYKNLMDFEITHWGRPSDNKGKLSISFYIASDILQPNLQLIRQSPVVQHILKAHKMNMSPHNLLQSDSKAIAFFSGKSVAHTWRKDLSERFQSYLTDHLNSSSAMLNVFGEDHEAPKDIPFYFRVTTIRAKKGTTQAITIYTGTLHKDILDTILQRLPFPDVEIVSFSLRRKDTERFERHVRLHEYICNNSCAIRLLRTSENSRDAIRIEVNNNSNISDKVVNLAEASKTMTDGTFYVQCLQKHKTIIHIWLTSFLVTYATAYPDEEQPVIPGIALHQTSSASTA